MVYRKFPTAQVHVDKIRWVEVILPASPLLLISSSRSDVFDKYARSDNLLGLNELASMFVDISKKMTNLPAVRLGAVSLSLGRADLSRPLQTAQVANQQGVYLGKKFSKIAQTGHDAAAANEVYDDPDDMLYSPFKYTHMGSLAYIGNSAVFDIGSYSFAGGLVAMCECVRSW